MQDELIDQGEDGSVGADSQGERKYGDAGKQGRFTQGAEGVAQVLDEISHADYTAAGWKGYLRAADQDAGDEDQHAADDDLKRRGEQRRVHVALANPGDDCQFHDHHDERDGRGEHESRG